MGEPRKFERRKRFEKKSSQEQKEVTNIEGHQMSICTFPYKCRICKKFFNARLSLEFHLKSQVHLRKMSQWTEEVKYISDPYIKEYLKFEPWNKPNYCTICKRYFSGPSDFEKHADGKVHRNEYRKRKMLLDLGPLPSFVQVLVSPDKDEKKDQSASHLSVSNISRGISEIILSCEKL